MATQRLYELFARWTAGQASPAEAQELDALLEDAANETDVKSLLDQSWENLAQQLSMAPGTADRIFQEALSARPPIRRILPYRWIAAASILLLIGLGIWIGEMRIHRQHIHPPVAAQPRDLPPGSNTATLTLANGQQLLLDSSFRDTLIHQDRTTIAANQGRLTYRPQPQKLTTIAYNTLTTPRGGQYQLTLPDGSRVWLDAASSITYPTAFTAGERTVQVQGQAYLEVAPDPQKPFRVKIGDTTIRVLGTAFNVNAYTDEPVIRITLLSGKIEVAARSRHLLTPGQQAIVSSEVTITEQTDTAQVMAWKNGLFAFRNADLPTVLRQLARWYNVDIRYEGAVPAMHFNGEIGKILTLRQVLTVLGGSNVHYTLDDRNTLTIHNP